MSTKLARVFASEAISNSHTGIKGCWMIVFSAGTFAALSTMKDVLIQAHLFNGTVPPDKYIDQNLWICLPLFLVFVLTFLRFFMGGVRVFDIRYSEIFKLVNTDLSEKLKDTTRFNEFARDSETFRLLNTEDPEDSKDLADFKKSLANGDIFKQTYPQRSETRLKQLVENSDKTVYKFEVVALTLQSLIVVFLAFQLGDWMNFAEVYMALLLCNAGFLALNRKISPVAVIALMFDDIFPAAKKLQTVIAMFPKRAVKIWIWNNLCFGGAFLAGLYYYSSIPLAPDTCGFIVGVAALLNCTIDFGLARDFYFPRFTEFLQKS